MHIVSSRALKCVGCLKGLRKSSLILSQFSWHVGQISKSNHSHQFDVNDGMIHKEE